MNTELKELKEMLERQLKRRDKEISFNGFASKKNDYTNFKNKRFDKVSRI